MASLFKNVAGQSVTFRFANATTGVAVTGATGTTYVTIDSGAQASGAGAITEKGHGQYSYQPTQAETNGFDVGFLFVALATSAAIVNLDFHTDPTNWGALNIDAFGNIGVQSNIKKNTASAGFMFMMTDSTTHLPASGLTVSGFVSLDGGAFVSLTNSVTGIANGWYKVNLAAADLNGNNVALRFTATGADDRDLSLITQP